MEAAGRAAGPPAGKTDAAMMESRTSSFAAAAGVRDNIETRSRQHTHFTGYSALQPKRLFTEVDEAVVEEEKTAVRDFDDGPVPAAPRMAVLLEGGGDMVRLCVERPAATTLTSNATKTEAETAEAELSSRSGGAEMSPPTGQVTSLAALRAIANKPPTTKSTHPIQKGRQQWLPLPPYEPASAFSRESSTASATSGTEYRNSREEDGKEQFCGETGPAVLSSPGGPMFKGLSAIPIDAALFDGHPPPRSTHFATITAGMAGATTLQSVAAPAPAQRTRRPSTDLFTNRGAIPLLHRSTRSDPLCLAHTKRPHYESAVWGDLSEQVNHHCFQPCWCLIGSVRAPMRVGLRLTTETEGRKKGGSSAAIIQGGTMRWIYEPPSTSREEFLGSSGSSSALSQGKPTFRRFSIGLEHVIGVVANTVVLEGEVGTKDGSGAGTCGGGFESHRMIHEKYTAVTIWFDAGIRPQQVTFGFQKRGQALQLKSLLLQVSHVRVR